MFCQPVLVSVSTVYLCDRVSDCLSEKSVCVSEVFVIFVWVSFTEFNCSLTFISNLQHPKGVFYRHQVLVRYSGFQTTRFPDIQISRYPDIQISRYPDIQISRYPDIQISRYPDIQISRYPDTQISRYPDIQIFRYSEIQIFIYQDIQIIR